MQVIQKFTPIVWSGNFWNFKLEVSEKVLEVSEAFRKSNKIVPSLKFF